jgi:multiple sugar transport system substrate-binding protein
MDDLGCTERKPSRRAFLRASFTCIGVSLLTACGASSARAPAVAGTAIAPTSATTVVAATAAKSTASPQPLPIGSAGKLTVIQRPEFFKGVETKFRDLVAQFAQSKGIELDISTANPAPSSDFNAKLQAAVQAGNPPDLAYHNLPITQLHALDLVEDVSDLVAEAARMYGDVIPVTAEKNARFDGTWWAVPYISTSGAWFARKDIFEAAGVDVNSLDTFDRRRAAALQVSDPSKEVWGWGLTINQSGDGHQLIIDVIQAFGGSITDAAGHKVTFNSPQTIEAVKWLQETYTSDTYQPMLPPGIESWIDTSNNEAYLAGKLALTSNAFSLYAKAKQDNNPVYGQSAILHKPKASDGKLLEAGANGWFTIFKGAKNADLARELIRHMLDPKHFTPMVREGGGLFLPAYKNLWTDDILKLDPNFATLKEIIFNPTPYTGVAYPADPNAAIDGVNATSIPSQMMANVTSGKMSAAQAVRDAHDRIVQIFEEAGFPQG